MRGLWSGCDLERLDGVFSIRFIQGLNRGEGNTQNGRQNSLLLISHQLIFREILHREFVRHTTIFFNFLRGASRQPLSSSLLRCSLFRGFSQVKSSHGKQVGRVALAPGGRSACLLRPRRMPRSMAARWGAWMVGTLVGPWALGPLGLGPSSRDGDPESRTTPGPRPAPLRTPCRSYLYTVRTDAVALLDRRWLGGAWVWSLC